jgi:DNA invertase Pin-like site-specific DNA recombinase
VERDLIRTRTAEGRGQHMGRPPRLTDTQKAEARRRRAEGATLAELARSYDVSKSTIYFEADGMGGVVVRSERRSCD